LGHSRLAERGEDSFEPVEAGSANGNAAIGNLGLFNSSPGNRDPSNMAPSVSPATGSALSNGPSFTSPLADLDNKVEEIYDIPVDGGLQPSALTGATTEGLPQGVLYRVRATYKYTREDVDEISFEVGDTIQVVEYDDPEEQEEGWLTGVKEGTTERGLFPANFTRPI
ncbi:Myc box-dependent-interacting protein 1-like, partial [Homarus americanus]